jgi:CheY-like chemotaxis protein
MAGKKLLVADDSLTIQKVIRLALSNEGYEIQAVSDGNDAIQQISLFRPDAILIDVSLPGKSAFEVKRAVNEHPDLEETRFILMSSAFEKVDEVAVEEVRFHGRLTKPFDPAHLRQVLTDTLAQVVAKRREPTSWLERPESPPPPADAAQEPVADEPVIDLPDTGDASEDWLTPVQPPASSPSAPSSSLSLEDDDSLIVAPPSPVGGIELPPPLSDESIELWNDDQPPAVPTRSIPAPAAAKTAPPPLPEQSESEPDADIRHLTESTIRMSGLDDYQWSVNEPSLKPTPSLLDDGGSNFEIEPPHAAPPESFPPFKPQAAYAPPPPAAREPEPELDSISLGSLPDHASDPVKAAPPTDYYRKGDTPLPTPPKPAASYDSRPTQSPAPPSSASYAAAPPPEASAVGISSQEIEELVRKELKKELQKLLPDLAERLIKQEIHKMLSETPT